MPFLSLPYGNIPDGKLAFQTRAIWNRLSSRIRKVMTPFLSFVLGKVTVVLLFMLKSVVKKLPQLAGQVLEEGQGLFHRHLQHLVDVLALVAHLQRLPVVPLALAHLAGDIDIRQEVHLNLDESIPGAGLAPSSPDVEGKPPSIVAPALGVLGGGEQLSDVVEQPGIGGRVGPGGTADRRLVDGDDLVQKLLCHR